jgi:hypothetical protein
MNNEQLLAVMNNISVFMQRVDLKGGEVPAYNVCMAFLAQEIERLQPEEVASAEEAE